MALFRRFFSPKTPDGLVKIAERVYVFDSCLKTDVLDNDHKYRYYLEDVVTRLQDTFPDASFMVFDFREQGRGRSLLCSYNMTVMEYPKQYEGCPLLTTEMMTDALKSGENWLSTKGQYNVLLMHCERGGWAVLAFTLAALLLYRKTYTSEQKTLEMVYKQAPRELIHLLSPINPMPSQMRYLHYISRYNASSEWPPGARPFALDCVVLRNIQGFSGEDGCRLILRIHGKDPLLVRHASTNVFSSTPKELFKHADCELIKINIDCHVQGDVVLECISVDADQTREEIIFRVMFNTTFIISNLLMLNRDEIDIIWNAKDQFPEEFRAEVILTEMDSESLLHPTEVEDIREEVLPVRIHSLY